MLLSNPIKYTTCMKQLKAVIFIGLIMVVSSIKASTPEYNLACNLYGRAEKGNKTALDSLRNLADNTSSGRAQQLYGLCLYENNNPKEAAEYFRKGAANGQYICANIYVSLLKNKGLPTYNPDKAKVYRENWLKEIRQKADGGDSDAILALGRALYGSFNFLSPDNYNAESRKEGKKLIMQSALKGNALAQYIYATQIDDLNDDEAEIWLSNAAENGDEEAMALMAVRDLEKGNYDSAAETLDKVIALLPDYAFAVINDMTVNDVKALAKFLKENPKFSLKGFGPDKSCQDTFFGLRNDTIIACATLNGKAGLLKLNRQGERINHDDIPFVYREITPIMHEFLVFSESDIFFIPRPYVYKTPLPESAIRVLDINGNETSFSIYSSYGPVVTTPDDFKYDGEDVNEK